ncbi:MAG TPA: hypothetical protein VLB68_23615 [Pyrinomonadaceae bacterium]|nr:hypothetical protein [Pyrinomonadaceae bacterium]
MPSKVDMADYVPADSIVYLEFNSVTDLVNAIEQSDAWRATASMTGYSTGGSNKVLTFMTKAGIGPTDAVILSRAQVALVVVRWNTIEENNTLRVKPDVALVVETHTSSWRTNATVTSALQRLAALAYGDTRCNQTNSGTIECASSQDRKIVGAIDGTVVIIGNSNDAVQKVLEVRKGVRPSLRTDTELLRVRSSMAKANSVGFGYISQANSAKLFSWAAPLLMGKDPGDAKLESVLASSANAILRGIAWTATPAAGHIEDRFQISCDPSVVAKLQPAFDPGSFDEQLFSLVPSSIQSLTIYRARQPSAAWTALNNAVAAKVGALPAVLFGTILKSGLMSYGITQPGEVLETLEPPLLTFRPSDKTESSVLVARLKNKESFRKLMDQAFKATSGQIIEGLNSEPSAEKEFTAVLNDQYVIVGKTDGVKECLSALHSNTVISSQNKSPLKPADFDNIAPIFSYADDEVRLNTFLTTLVMLKQQSLTPNQEQSLREKLKPFAFATTETSLNENGIERKTESSFGQFSTLMSLLQSSTSRATNDSKQ